MSVKISVAGFSFQTFAPSCSLPLSVLGLSTSLAFPPRKARGTLQEEGRTALVSPSIDVFSVIMKAPEQSLQGEAGGESSFRGISQHFGSFPSRRSAGGRSSGMCHGFRQVTCGSGLSSPRDRPPESALASWRAPSVPPPGRQDCSEPVQPVRRLPLPCPPSGSGKYCRFG